MQRAEQTISTLHETEQCHRQHRLRDSTDDPEGLLDDFAADAKSTKPFPVETRYVSAFLETSFRMKVNLVTFLP